MRQLKLYKFLHCWTPERFYYANVYCEYLRTDIICRLSLAYLTMELFFFFLELFSRASPKTRVMKTYTTLCKIFQWKS